ncbi:hypothetical protein CC1G_04227 [Coprinopsis cinerea okayama7|uniref:Uncharacterized protein n=1 Tax=Coprinopsis cinerea (strain Okayama-7 / 130 / ATCC MYA-4618 / FGSC 9003) TaxID=240176 RepID=A8NFC3_COPC7|nr:hypothetical protein CC1G_04227 [Coprinopsis cinerea okayama7\|eukprot:XP_001833248.2 hypothetical protein CC1G_04227 [Coprinopsis cinerea okayama7\
MSEKAPPPYPEPALALAPISESIHAPAPAPVPHSSGYAVQAPEAHPQPRAAPAPAANLGAQYQQDRLAQCAVGNHDTTTKYGACGIIFAILCFPIGLVGLCIDREERCVRCGARM